MTEETEAGAEFVRLFNETTPVTAAFWLKGGEEGLWHLYIASEQFNDRSLRPGYGEVLRLAGEITSLYFDPFQVKLVPTDHPFARAALDAQRDLGKRAIRLRPVIFGGKVVDEVFIYPPVENVGS